MSEAWNFALIVGGARSGKSLVAEKLAKQANSRLRYVATAEAWDEEMRERIAEHRRRRGEGWLTVEAPLDLAGALSQAEAGEIVLVDCLTLWLTNVLLAARDLPAETAGLLAALHACPAPVVLVTNEVGWSIVPENALARRFRDAQGRLNQAIAARADLVIGVMAGLPFALKGALPGGLA